MLYREAPRTTRKNCPDTKIVKDRVTESVPAVLVSTCPAVDGSTVAMAYVTRFRYDLFVSYSHNDDPTWISGFERALAQELRGKLGSAPAVWRDEHSIRLGQQWQDTITEGIKATAVFVAILSPGYQNSDWCKRERNCFMNQFPSLDDMKVALKAGNAYRFLKIVKAPWDDWRKMRVARNPKSEVPVESRRRRSCV